MLASWTFHGGFDPIDIEIRSSPAAVDATSSEDRELRLRELVRAFKYRDSDARRVVFAMHQWATGQSLSQSAAHDFDVGSSRAEAFADEVVRRLGRANLVVRRRVRRSVVLPVDVTADDAMGPDSTRDAPPVSKTWVGLTLADQNGTPIPNRAYRIIKPDGTTIDGTLDSNGSAIVQGLDAGNCQIWCPYVEPRPATTYTVADGDHISGIAQSHGYDDYTTLWNDPGNADLQSQRSDPHVLQPGDSLVVPEVKAQPATNKPTSAKHPFTLNVSPLKLRLTMLDLLVKPMASAPVTVAGTSLTTDGQGLVEAPVDKTATDATLVSAGTNVELSLGGLNPSDDTSEAGYKARLYNLGFLWDSSAEDTDNEMLIALQDFQAQYSLTVSGELDDATKGQLLQVHGC